MKPITLILAAATLLAVVITAVHSHKSVCGKQ